MTSWTFVEHLHTSAQKEHYEYIDHSLIMKKYWENILNTYYRSMQEEADEFLKHALPKTDKRPTLFDED